MKVWLLLILLGISTYAGAACTVKDGRPDPVCTPGAVMSTVTAKDICVSGYTAKVRNVPDSLKKQVFANYGMNNKQKPCPCEIDHYISLELGGSNDIKNLWPQTYANPLGARVKDQVENYLHDQVCKGNITLEVAQQAISSDWKSVYAGMHKHGQ